VGTNVSKDSLDVWVLLLQMRKRRIEKVILAGPAGNLCIEAHLSDFLEHGCEVAMVRDATAGTKNEEAVGLLHEAAAPRGTTPAADQPLPAA
jgi:nicotinamidase-related amidase